jgi:hypothetical protein
MGKPVSPLSVRSGLSKMLSIGTRVFLACKLSRSTFAAERVFAVTTSSGADYKGIAPLTYCYKNNGTRLPSSEPKSGQVAAGKLAARIVSNGSNKARVTVPDGETIEVKVARVTRRP